MAATPIRASTFTRILVTAALALLSITGARGDVIHVEPGPDFGVKVVTPWGNFVAVPEGNALWVGTEADYAKQRAIGISHDEGFRVIHIHGGSANTTTFVSAGLPSATVGRDDLGGIDTEILFGVGVDRSLHRRPIPAADERVSIVWTPSEKRAVQARIYDETLKRSYSPYTCGMTEGFSHCEWAIPRQSLTNPVALVFTARGSLPGIVRGASIAKMHYAALVDKYKPVGGSALQLGADDRSDLGRLRDLDPSIPGSIPGAAP